MQDFAPVVVVVSSACFYNQLAKMGTGKSGSLYFFPPSTIMCSTLFRITLEFMESENGSLGSRKHCWKCVCAAVYQPKLWRQQQKVTDYKERESLRETEKKKRETRERDAGNGGQAARHRERRERGERERGERGERERTETKNQIIRKRAGRHFLLPIAWPSSFFAAWWPCFSQAQATAASRSPPPPFGLSRMESFVRGERRWAFRKPISGGKKKKGKEEFNKSSKGT